METTVSSYSRWTRGICRTADFVQTSLKGPQLPKYRGCHLAQPEGPLKQAMGWPIAENKIYFHIILAP